MTQDVNLKEFVSGFVLEADEHLHSVNRNLVAAAEALKLGRPEPRAIRELFRSIHTIKGLASMVGAEPIVEITHEMETILRNADHAGGRISEKALDLIMEGSRTLEDRVKFVSKNGVGAIVAAPAALIEALTRIQNDSPATASRSTFEFSLPPEITRGLSPADREQIIQSGAKGESAVLVEFQPSPEKAESGFNITSVRERLAAIGELIKVVPKSSPSAPTGIAFSLLLVTRAGMTALVEATGEIESHIQVVQVTEQAPPEMPLETLAESESVEEWMPTDQSSIRVDISRLDEALERLGDLVISRSRLGRVEADLRARGVDTRDLKNVIADNARQLKRLRTAITSARMVSLSELLQRLPLVVRGLTKGTEKSVNIDIQAGSAEVDKAVADKIFPAVVHLVRNAVDHAIETREERKAAGKPEVASLTIKCDDSFGTNLVLMITDDGRGIDRNAVAKKAGRGVAKTNEELLQQISMPGLSTSKTITHVSGRGMGMDIVKQSIEQLGGELNLSTEPGHGTSFNLRVPVSITIVDVMSFVCGTQTFVAPVSMIDEIIDLDFAKVTRTPITVKGPAEYSLLQRREESIPLMNLEALLASSLEKGVTRATSRRALVVNQARGPIAFGIDRMLGQQEVVVRPLEDILVKKAGISGATDLGDGKPTLVLDLATIGAAVMQNTVFSP